MPPEASSPKARSASQPTPRQVRVWERLHILATLREYGPMTGLEVVRRANGECVCDAFEALPDLTNCGIGQKLAGLRIDGYVIGRTQGAGRLAAKPAKWEITNSGRRFLESGIVGLGQEQAPETGR